MRRVLLGSRRRRPVAAVAAATVVVAALLSGAGLARAGPPAPTASLCAALVGAVGCGAGLGSLGSERTVWEVCPDECGEGRWGGSDGASSLSVSAPADATTWAVRRRHLQGSAGVGNSTACPGPCPLCTATATAVDLQCIQGNEAWEGEYDVKQACVDQCMESEKPLPLVFALGTTFVLVCCSAFCSGLTLGLMGLDLTMLQVILESGSEIDKKRAAKITPLRSTGNRLLCVLLITNTAVNAGLAIVMAGFTGGFEGFVLSTLLIMIFGEITPQAICSRHGLAIGAFLYPVIWTVCWAFFPLAYPIAQVLDLVLGSEIGLSYSRDELIALLAMHSIGGRTKQGPAGDIHDTEAKILQGVLKFSGKTAEDVYTPLRHVGMLGMHEVFNLKVINAIYRSGHSRIPVYDGKKDNMVGIVFVKDLLVIDPEDSVPVVKVMKYFDHPLLAVSKDIGLLTLLDEFMEGHSHMCVIVDCSIEALPGMSPRLTPEGMSAHSAKDGYNVSGTTGTSRISQAFEVDGAEGVATNPVYSDEPQPAQQYGKQLGVVTLEDLMEEMLTMQIHDEHDVYLLEHRGEAGRDAVVEKIVNERSKAAIHEAPPRWMAHYGIDHKDVSDTEYNAIFDATLEELCISAGATEGLEHLYKVQTRRTASMEASTETTGTPVRSFVT